MKFLPPTAPDTAVTRYCGFARLENYLDNTKQTIADNLSIICRKFHHNLTQQERESLHKLQRASQELTIKPADKNLGIVVMDTSDYIGQCLDHLTDSNIYKQPRTISGCLSISTNYPEIPAPRAFMGYQKYISHIHVFVP